MKKKLILLGCILASFSVYGAVKLNDTVITTGDSFGVITKNV